MKTKKHLRIATFKDYVGELTVQYRRTKSPQTTVKTSRDAEMCLRPIFDDIMDDHEEFKVVHLNNSNGIVNIDHVSSGTDTATVVSVKDLVRNTLLIKCHAVILAHNHPSGNLNASQADLNLTTKIKKALEYFDIRVLDHIILTREGYRSLADNGQL